MKKTIITILLFLVWGAEVFTQPCGISQTLSSLQQSQINTLAGLLDTELKNENLDRIDSLSLELKKVFGNQAGIPDSPESYYPLVANNGWLNISNSISLSRILIAADSTVYSNLWKAAKGLKPPTYMAHSLYLRASAEIAAGLLKIAEKETDLSRKSLYRSWALKALDSLATMQIKSGPSSGAFPFPDLRTYGDPVFSPIIQKFILACGADSVNVLKNGWIIDDKGSGEFLFDAGVIANAYFEAYNYTGKTAYKDITCSIGNYLRTARFNKNYNYNTFASLGLTRAYELSGDISYLERALKTIRYSVYPGQTVSGRWLDGHNANSRYHSIIIQNIVPVVGLLPQNSIYKTTLETMTCNAVRNLVRYTLTCNSATGYRWLLKAFKLQAAVIPQPLNDSLRTLIGRHISQSALNGKYLDIPTMGEYFELLSLASGINDHYLPDVTMNSFPNPSKGITTLEINISRPDMVDISLFDISGRLVRTIDRGQKTIGIYNYQIDLSSQKSGLYFLTLRTGNGLYSHKIVRPEF